MRRRYNPNQLELFPEYVQQDMPQAPKRSRVNSQRSAERVQPLRSHRGLHTGIQLPLPLGCGCLRREEHSDAADVIEQEVSPVQGDTIGDEAALLSTSQV
jgi:hypothetical protein